MNFFAGEPFSNAIRDAVASGPVDMAVAFWGADAVARLRLPRELANYRIVCDAMSGSCSPKAIGELIERGASVVDLASMHAKLYLGSEMMVVGSANASANGLCEEAEEIGLEVGVMIQDEAVMKAAGSWFDLTFDAGRILGVGDLPEIERRWLARRDARLLRSTLAEAILNRAPSLADRTARAYVYHADTPAKETEEYFKMSPAFDPSEWERDGWPFFWGDQPGVSEGDVLVCFEVSARGAARPDGVWRCSKMLPGGPEPIWPATELELIDGVSVGDMAQVAKLLKGAVKDQRLKVDGAPIPLASFASMIGQS